MNKRQAKKAFKKKYGITPQRAADILSEAVSALSESIPRIAEYMAKALDMFAKELPKAIKRIAENITYIDSEEYLFLNNTDYKISEDDYEEADNNNSLL